MVVVMVVVVPCRFVVLREGIWGMQVQVQVQVQNQTQAGVADGWRRKRAGECGRMGRVH